MNTGEVIALLGVGEQPTTGEVRVARRRVAKRLHPDLGGEQRTRAMADVNAACDRLMARIRRGDLNPPPPRVATRPVPVVVAVKRFEFRPVYAAIALATMLLAFTFTVTIVGASAGGVAAGLLVAAVAGGCAVGGVLLYLSRH